jgi:SnoaL-like domain
MTADPMEGAEVNEAESFVESWSKIWRGPDSDPELYMELLHEGCPLINPVSEIRREDLPGFMQGLLETEPDIRVTATRWAETDDGVLIEWVNTGTLAGRPIEIRGADRFTLRDGRATEGYAYFDPRPLLSGAATGGSDD